MKAIYRANYRGDEPDPSTLSLADKPPPWRQFLARPTGASPIPRTPRRMQLDQVRKGKAYLADDEEAQLVNAALVLRRPLLIEGQPGVGKTTLAYSVAWQLGLGNVLRWSVTSRSTLKDALYSYDGLARLHDASLLRGSKRKEFPVGSYFTLGPLGTALLPTGCSGYFPRVLLIDEVDKGDSDLPNDLLHVLEDGSFVIPELARIPPSQKSTHISVRCADPSGEEVQIPSTGRIQCDDFPLVIMTTNGERDFPPAFKRRCLPISIPSDRVFKKMVEIVKSNLGLRDDESTEIPALLEQLQRNRPTDYVWAVDQILNAVYLVKSGVDVNPLDRRAIRDAVLRSLVA